MNVRKYAVLVLGFLFAALTGIGMAGATNVTVSCGAVGKELELCKQGAEAWAKKSGNTVTLVSSPPDSNARLALYQQLLGAGSADIDVFQIDVIWPGILANHLIDLKKYVGNAVDDHFPAMIKNDIVGGRLVAMPWFTDAGVLYYRKDLLQKYNAKVPETWEEMTATALKIQDGERKAGNDKMWGYVFQGRAYEGLTCNGIEWLASHNGGSIVEPDGKVSIDNPGAIAAFKTAASWIDKISPKGALNYAEEESRGVFQSGNAVFMRNWPYAWGLANSADSPIKDKVGIVALPKGGASGRHASALGGWQAAVSKYSKNPDQAADLVKYLTSTAEQKRRAIEGNFQPTIASLYKDKDVLTANPFYASLFETFQSAVPRPATVTGSKYNQVSSEFYNTTYSILSGQVDAAAGVKELDAKLRRLSRGGKW
jgi:trehalose/maltose transport system substrate-binding protein